MLFLDSSSPRPGHMSDAWFIENSPLFSPTVQPPYSYHRHSSAAVQSPLMKRSKRRLSDDFQSYKKTCSNDRFMLEKPPNDWPVFEHPHGGIVQQSPYGNIRVVKVGNAEISSIEKKTSLDFFRAAQTTDKEQNGNSKNLQRPHTPATCPSGVNMSPSPSAEVEGYMLEGYRELNKSYTVHKDEILNVNYSLYDQSHEDAHLDGLTDDANDDHEMAL